VVRTFGVNLVNGRSLDELWNYTLGTDSTGSYIATGSLTDPLRSISSKDATHEV